MLPILNGQKVFIEITNPVHGGEGWEIGFRAWSPARSTNGAKTWQLMEEVNPGDVILHIVGNKRNKFFIGFSIASSNLKETNDEPPKADKWSNMGTYQFIELTNYKQFDEPQHIGEFFSRYDEQLRTILINNPKGQFYNLIPKRDILQVAQKFFARCDRQLYSIFKQFISDHEDEVIEEEEMNNISSKNVPPTTKEQLVKARVGQGLFRSRVEKIENACVLTGVTDKRFLIASHIKPWRNSTDSEKLDGNNGLLLSPHVDKLFDKGYISFSDEGNILLAHNSVELLMNIWNLPIQNVSRRFNSKQKEYLDYHRTHVFHKMQQLLAGS